MDFLRPYDYHETIRCVKCGKPMEPRVGLPGFINQCESCQHDDPRYAQDLRATLNRKHYQDMWLRKLGPRR